MFGKNNFIKAVCILTIALFSIFAFSGCDDSSSSLSDNSSDTSSENISFLELLEALQNDTDIPFTINDNAKKMLKENEELFVGNGQYDLHPFTDFSLDYRMLSKNIDKYGDKLIFVPEAYVMSISETTIGDKPFTETQLMDENEFVYYVLSEASYDDIYEDDVVSFYGLPLGDTSFDNVSGGTTLAIVFAGCSMRKLY